MHGIVVVFALYLAIYFRMRQPWDAPARLLPLAIRRFDVRSFGIAVFDVSTKPVAQMHRAVWSCCYL